MAENLYIPQSEKWVTPNRVPKTESIYMLLNDPRNNPEFLAKNPNVVFLSDFSVGVDLTDDVDFTNEDPFSDDSTTNPTADPELPPAPEAVKLFPPTDLSISNFELKKDTGDGTFSYTANLSFTDAENAISYRAIVNAVK